jgi:hypothetical protein
MEFQYGTDFWTQFLNAGDIYDGKVIGRGQIEKVVLCHCSQFSP